MPVPPRLVARGMVKNFYHTQALRGVDIELRVGEVLAIVGENGAGKSTLAKIIAGVHRPDAGEIMVDGQPAVIDSVQAARRLGIAVVHQELNLVPHLTVADNIYLAREPTRMGFLRVLDRPQLYRAAQDMLEVVGATAHPDDIVRDLPLAQRQLVEIARALSERARVLILDEPTSSLAEADAAELLTIVKSLREQGLSVLYISHRLDEVLEVADRIAVLRDGLKVGEVAAGDATAKQLATMMVGRELSTVYPDRRRPPGEVVLKVRSLQAPGLVRPVSFSVRAGEIFGVAGLVGSGRSELLRAIFGANPATAGTVTVCGRPVNPRSPAQAMAAGIAFVSEDRKLDGLILNMSVCDNVVLAVLRRLAAWIVRRPGREVAAAWAQVQRVGVRLSSLDQPVRLLSGGNQQKTLLAKWLATRPSVLLLDDPTRGIDIGAKQDIYRLIVGLAEAGAAIVMVSSELEEIVAMCDTVLVMREGAPAGILERGQISERAIMELAAA